MAIFQTLDDIVKNLKSIPSTPKVLPKLMKTLSSPDASIQDAVDLILVDQSIAAKVLKISNSAFYAKTTRCDNLEQAINRVGFSKCYDLVAVAVSEQILMKRLNAYNLEAIKVWERSVATAQAAEHLCQTLVADIDPNVAYSVGLFHTVGLIAIDAWVKTHPIPRPIQSRGLPDETIDDELKMISFCENAGIAGALLNHWEFPRNIVESVRYQYTPERTPLSHQRIACMLHLAKWLQDEASHPEDTDESELSPLPRPAVLQILNMSQEQLSDQVPILRQKMAELALLLQESQVPAY